MTMNSIGANKQAERLENNVSDPLEMKNQRVKLLLQMQKARLGENNFLRLKDASDLIEENIKSFHPEEETVEGDVSMSSAEQEPKLSADKKKQVVIIKKVNAFF